MAAEMKRVAYVTGSRADFGLMGSVLESIAAHPNLALSVYIVGEHLSSIHGESAKLVEAMFSFATRLSASIEGDSQEHQARFTADLHRELVNAFVAERPDVVLLLGDRPEMLVAALVATYLRIPIAHMHGGDLSTSVDNTTRFAISRLAHLHLPATVAAAERLFASGEERSRIKVVGAPAVDRILHTNLPSRTEIFDRLQLDPADDIILVTQHPTTETAEQADAEMEIVLSAVEQIGKTVVVLHPHVDPGGTKMMSVIRAYGHRSDVRLVSNLPYMDFLALARESAVWVGNSSAGVIESASLHVPVVNVGSRQTGRERGTNVVDAPIERETIREAIYFVLTDPSFRSGLPRTINPWGDGNTGRRVAQILSKTDFNSLMHKLFVFPV